MAWLPLAAQRQDPVKWTLVADSTKAAPGATIPVRLETIIEPGWHVYSLTTPAGGPNPTKIKLADNPAIAGFRVFQPKPEAKLDEGFGIKTETYEEHPAFPILVQLKKDAAPGSLDLTAQMRYQVCSGKTCLPPRNKTANLQLTIDSSAPAANAAIPPEFVEVKANGSPANVPPPSAAPAVQQSFGAFLLVAFGFGLASIFTPCVFPMIPITVSFFLDRDSQSKSQGVMQALVFSLGIVLLFTTLGLGTALVFHGNVSQLGSNAWVNGFISIVFLIFGLSLLGAFEITLPSGLLTKMNSASAGGGYAGTLVMGLTFSLTAFACVGPFIGTLLAASVQQSLTERVLGMVFFALGLAAPFFLLALFPAYLQKLPRGGWWLVRVKMVMGFVILAAMLKYVASIDQVLQTNLLTRPIFLAAWFVLFTMPGLYLLGLLRLEGIKGDETLGVGRMLTGAAFLIFAVSLLPGMFGASLGELDAYVPAATGPMAFGGGAANPNLWMKNQYPDALAKAKQENKLLLVNFTGYACTNCHWMKANMFPRPEIAAALKDLVLVELYTDGSDEASRLNQEMEDKRFQTVAMPYYALLDSDEKVVKVFPGLTKDPQEFLSFLKSKT